MRIFPLSLLTLAFAAGSVVAQTAAEGEVAVKKHGCMACHDTNKKVIGPAYKDVSTKYKKVVAAETTLATKIKTGGQGTWGPVPMPPHPAITDKETASMAKWILSQ